MWANADKEDLLRAWGEQLAHFTGDDIREALLMAPSGHKEYPPTLPQFVDLCRDAMRRRIGYQPKLPRPAADKKDADAALEALKSKAQIGQKGDKRQWARNILADETGKHFPHISYVMAREALGISREPQAEAA